MYLSSFRMGEHPEALVALAGRADRAAVIANAMDAQPAAERAAGVRRELDALTELGFNAEELDLREYFTQGVSSALERYVLVWLRGGNVFVLRYALAASGADAALAEFLRQDALVYAGYSAGPCCAGPTLRGLELVDRPDAVRLAYDADVRWDGLGILDYAIVPHYRSPDHPETERVERVVAHYRGVGIPYRTLSDGQALVVDGDRTLVV